MNGNEDYKRAKQRVAEIRLSAFVCLYNCKYWNKHYY